MAKDLMRSGTDGNREENELMLELSIGGIFGRSEKTKRNVVEFVQNDDDREEDLNVQSKREVQALRRKELRRKREEKLKKSVGFGSCGSVSGPFVDNKEWLERQIVGRNDEVLEVEPARKKERIGNLPENVAVATTNGFVNQNAPPVSGGGGQAGVGIDEGLNTKNSSFRQTTCRSFRPYQNNVHLKAVADETDGGGRRNSGVNSNGSAGYASSAFSDSQCSSRQGGGTDDSRSNSSNSQLDQLPSTSAASDPSEQPTNSSKQTISTNKSIDVTISEPGSAKPNPSPESPSVSNPHSKPEPSTNQQQQQQASFLARMPCVSTTGNGPNGKTVSGFLYRYTKNEVSIVCVCHGQSFSPAGFVEHAGGVGILHPLKHITILPTAFAS